MTRSITSKSIAVSLFLLALSITIPGAAVAQESFDVAVYFPGDLGSNPIEPPITAGVERVREDFDNVNIRIIEGGNPSEWEAGLIALSASGQYELIISFTDGLPQILETVSPMFPDQRYALLDSSAPGLDRVYSLVYSDEALGFLGGAFAALVASNEELSLNSSDPTVGLLAGTPYPAMDNKILPGYRAGAHYVDEDVEVLYAAVGDWNDPNRARDLALNMYNRGTSVIMSITGGGDSGVHRAAGETGGYAVAVNTNQNAVQPGVILTSVLKRLDNSIYSVVEQAMAGELAYGTVETAGVEQGAISIAADELYVEYVPQTIRDAMDEIMEGIESGEIDYLQLLQEELDS